MDGRCDLVTRLAVVDDHLVPARSVSVSACVDLLSGGSRTGKHRPDLFFQGGVCVQRLADRKPDRSHGVAVVRFGSQVGQRLWQRFLALRYPKIRCKS
jgi:hypothetical protein